MSNFLSQVFYLLGSERRKIPILIPIFLIASAMDLLGLSLIGPYVALVMDQDLSSSQYLKAFERFGLPQDHKGLGSVLALALFLVFSLKAVLGIAIYWVIVKFSQDQQQRLRTYLMSAYQSMPYTEYLRRNSSEYIFNIHSLTGAFSDVLRVLLRITCDGIIAIVIIVLLARTDMFALMLLVSTLGIFILGYDRGFRRLMSRYGQQFNVANTRLVQGINEGIQGFRDIRILRCQSYFLKKVEDNARLAKLYQIRLNVTQQAPWYLVEWVMVTFVVALVLGAPLMGGEVSALLPTLGVFAVAGLRLVSITNTLSTGLVQLRFAKDHVSRLFNDVTVIEHFGSATRDVVPDSDTDVSRVVSLDYEFQTLKIRDLSYRYPGAKVDALCGIDLDLNAGESIGVIGRSGAGKTTLVDVLLGLLEPDGESIMFNGRPLQSVLHHWHSQAAYLPQEVFLIDDSVRRNVALGVADEVIDETRLDEALRRARLSELINQLPSGVDTKIGESGTRLSGGQRQRVALARAFYHDRRVLVMDESTSALDNETEKEVIEEIKLLRGETTVIVIAHRLTTVEQCDRVYELEQGKIINFGTPEQVLNFRR